MSDQLRSWLLSHHRLRTEEKFSKKAKVFSISSGKGGVGKTSMTLKLGKVLAKSGQKVLVIDCDYNLSNTFVKLGVPMSGQFNKYIKSLKDFQDCLYKDKNFHVLAGCNGDLDLLDNALKMDNFYINLITQVEQEYDFILLDTPAGMTKDLMSLNAYADHRIFVVTPDRSSITDSYSCIKVLNNRYGIKENFLLVNGFKSEGQYKNIVKVMGETVDNFLQSRLLNLGGVRKSKNLGEQFDHELLFEEKSSLHQDCLKVVSKLSELVGVKGLESEVFVSGAKIQNHRGEHDVHWTAN